MSLFKARDWWSSSVGQDEEFDQGCLCVANIDNSATGHDKIILGSYMGFLRVYAPNPSNPGEAMNPEEQLVEVHLKDPIIQVEAGKFVSGTENLHLAVLQPRKLSVYTVSGTTGTVDHGNQYQLRLIYEHNLQRTACNMAYGPFGGVKAKVTCLTTSATVKLCHLAHISDIALTCLMKLMFKSVFRLNVFFVMLNWRNAAGLIAECTNCWQFDIFPRGMSC